jgi:hypothetical protein
MSGNYTETQAIVATRVNPLGINVISEPGVKIDVDLDGGFWINDNIDTLLAESYPIIINWEGGFSYRSTSPTTELPYTIKMIGNGDYLYRSIVDSYIRFKNVCIIKKTTLGDGKALSLFFLNGNVDYGIATRLYLDGCRIYSTSAFEPIINIEDSSTPEGFKTFVDIKSSELIWNGEWNDYPVNTVNKFNCIRMQQTAYTTLNIRNSLIYGINGTSGAGNESPIYSGGPNNKISINDVQFHSAKGSSGTAGLLPTIYSQTATLPIYIGARCISEFDSNNNCSNPLTGGDLRTGLFFPPPII